MTVQATTQRVAPVLVPLDGDEHEPAASARQASQAVLPPRLISHLVPKHDDGASAVRHAVAEVFAGLGCVARGFSRSGPFNPVYLNDNDPLAAATFRANAGSGVRYDVRDVQEVTGDDIRRAADGRPLAGLLGCPPCQGWSAAGRRAADDKRNRLIEDFFRLVTDLKPLFFVMENVPAVAGRPELSAALRELAAGYRTWSGVLNAAAYGLPQSRQRTLVLGYRSDAEVTPKAPAPTHAGSRPVWDYRGERLVVPSLDTIDDLLGSAPRLGGQGRQHGMSDLYRSEVDELSLSGLTDFVTVEEAIGDLDESTEETRPSSYAQQLRSPAGIAPANHVPWGHGPGLVQRLRQVPEGQRPPLTATNGRRYYSQAYARLHRLGLARTITTNFHNPGSGRFLHYQLQRTLTVREAARLQGLEDDWAFTGRASEQTRLVGNAFPLLWAEAIARHVAYQLHGVLAKPLPVCNPSP